MAAEGAGTGRGQEQQQQLWQRQPHETLNSLVERVKGGIGVSVRQLVPPPVQHALHSLQQHGVAVAGAVGGRVQHAQQQAAEASRRAQQHLTRAAQRSVRAAESWRDSQLALLLQAEAGARAAVRQAAERAGDVVVRGSGGGSGTGTAPIDVLLLAVATAATGLIASGSAVQNGVRELQASLLLGLAMPSAPFASISSNSSSSSSMAVSPSPVYFDLQEHSAATAGPSAAAAAAGAGDVAVEAAAGRHVFDMALAADAVARRLDGIPVYTVCNSNNEFVLISDMKGSKSVGLFCFREDDAKTLLAQVRDRDPSLGRGARVVPVSLDKVYLLAAEGIAFRFLPDPTQVKNAIQIRAQVTEPGGGSKAFEGVPVFQSENLILRSKNRRFSPVFFTKEDLEAALRKAFRQRQKANPNMKPGTEMQVGSFEAVLKELEKCDDDSPWADLIFVPPGVTDTESQLKRAVAFVPLGKGRPGKGGPTVSC